MEDDFKLIAPHVNRLLSCYEGFQNPEQPGAELMKALDPLFKAMADLAPYEKNDEAKGIWIIVPRGDITDWGDFESEKEDGEVDSYEEFEQIWRDYYPNETEWYFVGISENKPDSNWKFRGLSVASRNRHHLVINAELREGTREETWYKEEPAIILCKLILPAVEHSMELLRKGLYNKMVEESLPYQHRTGVIPRKVEWEYYPEAKTNIFEGLSTNTFLVLYHRSIYESLSRDMLHCWGCCGLVCHSYRMTVQERLQPQPPCRVVNQLDTARRFMWNEVTSGKRPVEPAASIHYRGGITRDLRRH